MNLRSATSVDRPLRGPDLAGQKFGRLQVVSMGQRTTSGQRLWLCVCECGNEKLIATGQLVRADRPTKSCGCARRRYPLIADFLSQHADTQGCWEYPSYRDKDGYAQYEAEVGQEVRAHRAAYAHANGPIPHGMSVLHSCDKPPCCRPSHLFLGSQLDNCQDAVAKDRHCRGERNGNALLSMDDIVAIRSDQRTQMEIAAHYGIRQTAVSAIKTRTNWRHIP